MLFMTKNYITKAIIIDDEYALAKLVKLIIITFIFILYFMPILMENCFNIKGYFSLRPIILNHFLNFIISKMIIIIIM